ncbi:glycosyltransferase family 2 protein [Pseudomonadota bacterium]
MLTNKSDNEPTVSIIIPALNAENYIAEALKSALHQTINAIEILMIDNGSFDNTIEIAQGFDDPRMQIYKCETLGAAAARNFGITHASGDYIQFLDADDVLAPNKIRLQLAEIIQSDPILTIASCEWLRFEESIEDACSLPETVWPIQEPIEWLISSLSGGGMMQTGAWLVHRDLIEAAGPWDETLSLHDDGEFFTRVLLQAEKNCFVSEAKIYYRTVPYSLSRQQGRGAVESAFRVCQSRDKHILACRNDQEAREAIATQYGQFAYEFSQVATDLSELAMNRIEELKATPVNSIGGFRFRKLVGLLGFRAALYLRRALL